MGGKHLEPLPRATQKRAWPSTSLRSRMLAWLTDLWRCAFGSGLPRSRHGIARFRSYGAALCVRLACIYMSRRPRASAISRKRHSKERRLRLTLPCMRRGNPAACCDALKRRSPLASVSTHRSGRGCRSRVPSAIRGLQDLAFFVILLMCPQAVGIELRMPDFSHLGA